MVFDNDDFVDIIEKLCAAQDAAWETKDNYDGMTVQAIKAKIDIVCHELDGAIYRLRNGGEK